MNDHDKETTIRILVLFALSFGLMALGCWKYRHPVPQPKAPIHETTH